jgi:hypothetical protein
MTKIEQIEREVADLAPAELAVFRKWFAEFDAEIWDRQMEADVNAGKLDALAERALRDHAEGKTTKF